MRRLARPPVVWGTTAARRPKSTDGVSTSLACVFSMSDRAAGVCGQAWNPAYAHSRLLAYRRGDAYRDGQLAAGGPFAQTSPSVAPNRYFGGREEQL